MESKLMHGMIYLAATIIAIVAALALLIYIEGDKPTEDEWK